MGTQGRPCDVLFKQPVHTIVVFVQGVCHSPDGVRGSCPSAEGAARQRPPSAHPLASHAAQSCCVGYCCQQLCFPLRLLCGHELAAYILQQVGAVLIRPCCMGILVHCCCWSRACMMLLGGLSPGLQQGSTLSEQLCCADSCGVKRTLRSRVY